MSEEYYEIVKDILENEEFLKRKTYFHHGKKTVYDHSLRVSIISYKISKILNFKDKKSVAIGALLHDFYDKPWQENTEKKAFFKKHGFVHAKQAVVNAKKYFPDYVNKKVENIIVRHMFPLNIMPPKYKEAWLVTLVDKFVSLEVFGEPSLLLWLLGLKSKKK